MTYRHFVAPDANNDTTLWRVYPAAPAHPQAILRLIDLPETARFLWPHIVEAVSA